MRTVISSLFYAWSDMDECFARARNEFGLDGVELSWHYDFARPHGITDDFEAIRPAKDKYGAVVSAHLWEDLPQLGPRKGQEAIHRWLDICRSTGAEALVIHGGTYPDRKGGLERIRQVLEKSVGRLEKDGVVLHLENHYAYDYRNGHELLSEPWEFLEIFEKIDSPSLRICFDTGHAHMTENTESLLAELSAWIAYIHMVDNNGPDDDHTGYGLGAVDWETVFAALRRVGFDGTVCVEFEVREDHKPFRRFMRDLKARFADEPI